MEWGIVWSMCFVLFFWFETLFVEDDWFVLLFCCFDAWPVGYLVVCLFETACLLL